ncbi:MAG: phage portal protein, partial [Bacteroidales bacterium]|nr:phage portal protein [Bacteroidales bacterium]
EAVYTKARIDTVNRKRMNAYFAACEIMTVWYPVEGKNKQYGFDSNWKLKCNTFSPMDSKFSMLSSANIYPIFDKYKDLIGLAYEYKVTEASKEVTYFHVYTSEQQKIYRQEGTGNWEDLSGEDSTMSIGKIPAVYLWRPMPVWEGITGNVHQIELSLSRESDILRRNSAPILKVKGKLVGGQPANEVAREVYQIEGDGDISYVTWEQQVDAMKYYTDTLKQNMEEELQLPNLSFDNVKSIGAITEGARKTLLTDAHLKVGDESGDILEFFDRECNVIKTLLGEINTAWKNTIMDLEVEHIITPFIQNDETAQIDKITKATQKPVMSQRTGIEQLGIVENIDLEYKQLQDEEKRSNDTAVFETAGSNE